MSKQWPPSDDEFMVYANIASKLCLREKEDMVVYLSWSEPEVFSFAPKKKFIYTGKNYYCKEFEISSESDCYNVVVAMSQ